MPFPSVVECIILLGGVSPTILYLLLPNIPASSIGGYPDLSCLIPSATRSYLDLDAPAGSMLDPCLYNLLQLFLVYPLQRFPFSLHMIVMLANLLRLLYVIVEAIFSVVRIALGQSTQRTEDEEYQYHPLPAETYSTLQILADFEFC